MKLSWLFTKWDRDKDGSLSVDDICTSLSTSGQSIPREAVEILMKKHGSDTSSSGRLLLDFVHFAELMIDEGLWVGAESQPTNSPFSSGTSSSYGSGY